MKAIFLGIPAMLDPWFRDIERAAKAKNIEIPLYDPAKPLEPQFDGVEVVVDQGGKVGTKEIIDLAAERKIKMYQVLGTGLDHTPVKYILEKGMLLTNTPGNFSAIALAEHAIMMMLMIAKNFRPSQTSLANQILCQPMNDEINGKTLGLIGFGASAQELAKRAALLGMRVIAIDTYAFDSATIKACQVSEFGGPEKLDDLLRQSDFISLHTPLNDQTRYMINKRAFELMKHGTGLVNVARGEIVDQSALEDALRAGKLSGAALDVFENEPIDPNNSLLKFDNVIATPHMAGVTRETSRRRAQAVVDNLERIGQGLEPRYRVLGADL